MCKSRVAYVTLLDRGSAHAAVIIAANSATKAYYHAGLPLLVLEQVDEALDLCPRSGEGMVDDAGFLTSRGCAEKKRREVMRRKEEDGCNT